MSGQMDELAFDVTLNWHVGGTLSLGTFAAKDQAEACESALAVFIAKNRRQRTEIEEGGGFELVADRLLPAEEARWLERWRAR